MHLWLYLVGIGIGLAASAPVGPANLLAISRALNRGFVFGLTTGLGAVVADSLVAGLSGLGLPWLVGAIQAHQSVIQFGGGLLLCGFGVVMMRSHPTLHREPSTETSHILAAPFSAFMMTITNPGAILAIVAVFGSVTGVSSEVRGLGNIGVMVGGMLTGGTAWWALISWGASRLRDRMTDGMLMTANRSAGTVIIVLGIGLCVYSAAAMAGLL